MPKMKTTGINKNKQSRAAKSHKVKFAPNGKEFFDISIDEPTLVNKENETVAENVSVVAATTTVKRVAKRSGKAQNIQPKALESTYEELCADIAEYRDFVVAAVGNLFLLEMDETKANNLNVLLAELDHIDTYYFQSSLPSKKLKEYSPEDLMETARLVNEQIIAIARIANKAIDEYKHLQPTAGSRFTHKNNTMLNRLLDSFTDFMDAIKSKLGFTAHLKRAIASDIKGMKAKHEPIYVYPTQPKPKLDKKGRMGFAYSNTTGAIKDRTVEIKLLEKTYADLNNEVADYLKFVQYTVDKLHSLERGKNNKIIDLMDKLRRVALNSATVTRTGDKKMREFAGEERNFKVQALNKKIDSVAAIADQIAAEYVHLNPTAGRKFATENNTRFNRMLDNMLAFVHKLKAKFGFTADLKRDLVSDIADMKAKHKRLPPLDISII